jgi:hypothetical protein
MAAAFQLDHILKATIKVIAKPTNVFFNLQKYKFLSSKKWLILQ